MRIIKGKDYYDSALAFGSDSDVVFVRDGIIYVGCDQDTVLRDSGLDLSSGTFAFKARNKNSFGSYTRSDKEILDANRNVRAYVHNVRIVLAGSLFRGLAISKVSSPNSYHYLWNTKELLELCNEYDVDIVRYGYTNWRMRAKKVDASRRSIELADAYFESAPVSDKTREWLIKNRITILTYGPLSRYVCDSEGKSFNSGLCVDGDDLGNKGFQKVMNPWQANQEIMMWVSGILPRNPNPMIEITDDKIKAEKHGFDKWSFRKAPKSDGR